MATVSEGFGVELDPPRWDGAQLDAEYQREFIGAFQRRRLVLVRGCQLSPEQQVTLTESLGEVSDASPTMKAGQKYTFISNTEAAGNIGDGELLFHSDFMFTDRPLRAISLFALAVPGAGGETVFIDAGAAYDRLSPELKRSLEGLQARHVANYGAFDGSARPRFEEGAARQLSHVHPVVWPHPVDGRLLLFVSPLLTESIVGMSRPDSEALLQELFATMAADEYVHRWQVGDYLVWDNCALQHSRRTFDPTEPRSLRRVPVAG